MLPASSTAGGMCLGVPDVCLTPAVPSPIPVPYPNMGQLPTATGFATKVKIQQMPALHLQSKIPRSQGDEAGTNGGVVSGVFGDQVCYRKGSAKVMVEGAPAVYATALTAHNGANANMPAGMQVAPSQVQVLVAP